MTAILKPDLIWIEGRCYRVNDSYADITSFQEHDLYENEVNYNDLDEDKDEDDSDIIMIDNNRFTSSIHVSKHYIGSIIGKKGAMKLRIERDTRTDIKIPKQGQVERDIVIFGSSASNVKAAKRRINIIVMSSRMKQTATHFISIPMNDPVIMKNFEAFKKTILHNCPSRGLDESLFIKANKLHLTVGIMCLMDNEERLHASKLFNEAKETIIFPLLRDCSPLKIRLKGLSYMNDDPREIDVLYAKVQEESAPAGVLQKLADGLVDHFCRAGYMDREHGRQSVKLHVTLINSKYRSQSSTDYQTEGSASRNSRQPRVTFDGSEILKRYIDYDFGVMELGDIHLSTRHSTGPDGFYQPTCVISCKL